MPKMISSCGINCAECGAFIATKTNDQAKRIEVAAIWSKQYQSDIKPENINCNGCKSTGDNIFHYCTICEIRACGKKRGVENCAHCPDYACEMLQGFFKVAPEAEKNLLEIRSLQK
jgi:hypothetical protein